MAPTRRATDPTPASNGASHDSLRGDAGVGRVRAASGVLSIIGPWFGEAACGETDWQSLLQWQSRSHGRRHFPFRRCHNLSEPRDQIAAGKGANRGYDGCRQSLHAESVCNGTPIADCAHMSRIGTRYRP